MPKLKIKSRNLEQLYNWNIIMWYVSYRCLILVCAGKSMVAWSRSEQLPEQRTPCAMRPHMKLAQYSHQCGPRNVCTWGSQQTCSYTHSTTCQILPVITTLALNWRASTGQMLVWDPVLKRTRPQMTACVRTRQIKGFTKDLLKCVWHLPVGNRIQARQAGVKITDVRLLQGDRSHTCRHTHTHTHLVEFL